MKRGADMRQSEKPISTTKACDGCGEDGGGDAPPPTPQAIAAARGDATRATEETESE
jgi:hypothetical protein